MMEAAEEKPGCLEGEMPNEANPQEARELAGRRHSFPERGTNTGGSCQELPVDGGWNKSCRAQRPQPCAASAQLQPLLRGHGEGEGWDLAPVTSVAEA